MARARIPIGDHGEISYRTKGYRKVRARTTVRDADGVLREMTREGTSEANARQNLLQALADRPGFSGSVLNGNSLLADAAAVWIADIDAKVGLGDLAPNTLRTYRTNMDGHVLPALGALRLREATVPRLDAFVLGLRAHQGSALTKSCRTVLSGILGFAVRQGAIEINPMREVSRIKQSRVRRAPRAMTELERDGWLAAMEADEIALFRDIPDLTRFMLATGCRIGEALAMSFAEVDVASKIVMINYTLVPIKGVGLARQPTKTAAGERTLTLPGWAVDMLLRRGDRFGWTGPLFPVPGWRDGRKYKLGVWRDPSNTSRDLREARDRAGFEWVTSHVFRKTVATVMDQGGYTAREIADQLGHRKISMTQDVYLGRAIQSRGAEALEDLFGDDDPHHLD